MLTKHKSYSSLMLALCVWCSASLAEGVRESGAAEAFDHSAWNRLVQAHVVSDNGGQSTAVNYQGMADQRQALKHYLDDLAAVTQAQFDGWSHDEQLAFLINAYNAWTVELILGTWPDLESIKDLGNWLRSPWSRALAPLLGSKQTLDNIEHDLIRGSGRYNNPLIHFAVNCASIGCPPLRDEAYTGAHLKEQLEQQTRLFLANRQQNRLAGDDLMVSSIFKWYRQDFERGWHGYQRLEDFLAHYADALGLSATDKARLLKEELDIGFLDYDWQLNQTR